MMNTPPQFNNYNARGQKKEIRGVMNDMCPLKTTTKVRGKKKERRGVRIEPIRHYIVD